jgi:hypothetical protein
VRLRHVLWVVAFLVFDRGDDEPRSCGAALAVLIVALAVVAMVVWGRAVFTVWMR